MPSLEDAISLAAEAHGVIILSKFRLSSRSAIFILTARAFQEQNEDDMRRYEKYRRALATLRKVQHSVAD